jgi:hypothetical protein
MKHHAPQASAFEIMDDVYLKCKISEEMAQQQPPENEHGLKAPRYFESRLNTPSHDAGGGDDRYFADIFKYFRAVSSPGKTFSISENFLFAVTKSREENA